jgi:ADP-ribosylation factor 1/2
MGNKLAIIGERCGFSKPKRIMMMGLDAAGKTTILYALKGNLNKVVTTIPTIGFNVEEVSIGGANFTAWDVGGRSKIRPLWRHYYQGTEGLVFVIDSNDRDRLVDAKDELRRAMAEDDLQGVPVLVFANKSDLPNALTAEELTTELDLGALEQHGANIKVRSCCAIKKDGLYEGLEWLADSIHGFNQAGSTDDFWSLAVISKYFAKITAPPSPLDHTALPA